MIKTVKHKIAFLLFLVFISRIMFVQMGIFYFANADSGKQVSKTEISAADRKYTHFEAEGQLKSGNYSVMEFLEDTDPDFKFKLFIIPALLMLLALPFAGLYSISSSYHFTGGLSFISLQRFLALRVIRI